MALYTPPQDGDQTYRSIRPRTTRLPSRRRGEPPAEKNEDNVLKALASVHPRYVEFCDRWQMYIDMYEGEHLMRYLKKHIRESQKSVDSRSSRLYYLNYCQPVVDLYTHYIFSKPVVRKENA